MDVDLLNVLEPPCGGNIHLGRFRYVQRLYILRGINSNCLSGKETTPDFVIWHEVENSGQCSHGELRYIDVLQLICESGDQFVSFLLV